MEKKPDRKPDFTFARIPSSSWPGVYIWVDEELLVVGWLNNSVCKKIYDWNWDNAILGSGIKVKNHEHLFELILADTSVPNEWHELALNYLAELELLK